MIEMKIKGHPDLVKTGASISSNDQEAYLAALRRAAKGKELAALVTRIGELEKSFTNIESKLDYIIKNINGGR